MTTRHILFVIGVWALTPAGTASAAVALLDGVTVRVYDAAGLAEDLKQSAFAAATRTLAAASIGIHWEHCERSDRICTSPLTPGQFVVRIVRTQKPAAALAREGLALGDAHVDSTARSGVLATIYADRVLLLAAASGIDAATLLGRAIAHEMGHLLLASNVHSTHGLMRARWSRDDLRRGRGADWMFTPEEVAAFRARY
jgi:hypothetical protein